MEFGRRVVVCSLAITVLLPLGCAGKTERVVRPFPKAKLVPPAAEGQARREAVPEEDVVIRRRPGTISEQDLEATRRAQRVKTLAEEAEEALGKVYFAYDSSDLTDEARQTLVKNAAWLKARPEVTVKIEGHCDERGTNEYNLALGERRASASKRYLESLGVDSSRIATISYGEEQPVDRGHNEAAWAKNRRAEFRAYSR